MSRAWQIWNLSWRGKQCCYMKLEGKENILKVQREFACMLKISHVTLRAVGIVHIVLIPAKTGIYSSVWTRVVEGNVILCNRRGRNICTDNSYLHRKCVTSPGNERHFRLRQLPVHLSPHVSIATISREAVQFGHPLCCLQGQISQKQRRGMIWYVSKILKKSKRILSLICKSFLCLVQKILIYVWGLFEKLPDLESHFVGKRHGLN